MSRTLSTNRGSVESLKVPGSEGEMGVLARHMPLLSALRIGGIRFAEEGGAVRHVATSGGFVEVEHNHVTVLAETAEFAEDIDTVRAQAAHKRAETDWKRSKQLVAQGITAEEEADARREGFEQAEIELASARDNLELIRSGRIAGRGRQMESIIRAPAAGIVLEREVDPGDPVVPLTSFQEGTELATIADMGDLIFKGTVDEIDVGKLTEACRRG